jgi:hypothetical protein
MVSLEFLIDIILSVALWPWVNSASNRNEYQEYFLGCKGGLCVGLTTLPPSCADCLEIWELQPPGNLKACNGIALPLTYLKRHIMSTYGQWCTVTGSRLPERLTFVGPQYGTCLLAPRVSRWLAIFVEDLWILFKMTWR